MTVDQTDEEVAKNELYRSLRCAAELLGDQFMIDFLSSELDTMLGKDRQKV